MLFRSMQQIDLFITMAMVCAFAAAPSAALPEGHWTLERLSVGPELGEFPLATKMGEKTVSMEVRADGADTQSVSVRVVNILRFIAKYEPSAALATSPFQGLRVTPGMSTLMMGPSGMMETEAAVAKGLRGVDKWLVRGDVLLLAGPTVEMSFVRAKKHALLTRPAVGRAAVKKEMFAKMESIRELKAKLRREGASAQEISKRVAPLLNELKGLKQKAGPANFEDVVPMSMPSKEPVSYIKVV